MKFNYSRLTALFALTLVIGVPVAVRFAKDAGYVATYQTLLYGTILMGAVCVVGAVVSYRLAQNQVKRNLLGDFN